MFLRMEGVIISSRSRIIFRFKGAGLSSQEIESCLDLRDLELREPLNNIISYVTLPLYLKSDEIPSISIYVLHHNASLVQFIKTDNVMT